MKAFAELYLRLDATTSSNAKLEALRDYFAAAPAEDAAWAVYFLAGGRPRQLVPTRVLRELATALAGLPDWLFERVTRPSATWPKPFRCCCRRPACQRRRPCTLGRSSSVALARPATRGNPATPAPLWAQLDRPSLMLCLKLITGSFRVGVSKLLVTRALAQLAGLDAKRVAQRLVGYTDIGHRPTAASYHRLIAEESSDEHSQRGGQPYPFFLAHALQAPLEQFEALLGSPAAWQIEWKWDGIRAQVVKRDGQLWIWSRGEELVTERFPELHSLAESLPDGTVLDGEILVWKPGVDAGVPAVQPFAVLQQRIGRKTLGKIAGGRPVVLQAYDLLEWRGEDWRNRPQHERRQQLQRLLADHPLAPAAFTPARGQRLGRTGAATRAIAQPGCGGLDAQAA